MSSSPTPASGQSSNRCVCPSAASASSSAIVSPSKSAAFAGPISAAADADAVAPPLNVAALQLVFSLFGIARFASGPPPRTGNDAITSGRR